MSDRMTCLPFSQLLDWILDEFNTKKTVFGIHNPYIAKDRKILNLFGRKLETPIGPAAGPHTQLAQNIIAAYFAGSRFFEVKTVQIIDGEDLPVSKPCIKADDEGYNVEWSTELYVPQAQDEYINAWVILHLMAKEFGFGSQDGFQFNMSVGYDLAGIKSEKINTFIDSLIEAKNTGSFKSAISYAKANIKKFKKVTAADIDAIPSAICNSATISTLHGCPPQEIENIANYLINEKHLNTFVKCNPTLLGYEFARKTLDSMGYDYLVFGEFHFKDDLQYKDAIPMFKRLMALAESKGLAFGVKITNTLPVDIKQNELPGKEMYMSGKALFPLSISLAAKLSRDLDGKLRISYSGGADFFNIEKIVEAGIWPVTIATTLLKPGGYQRILQLAEILEAHEYKLFTGVDVKAISKVAEEAVVNPHYIKSVKLPPSRKMKTTVPLIDCYVAPCEDGCPIHQDVSTYMKLASEGDYTGALKVITDKNPLPFITGTVCAHNCMTMCTRNFYESPVHIRNVKLESAKNAYESILKELAPLGKLAKKIAIVGGGPAGIAAAFYLARAGAKVTLFEKKELLGGIVTWTVPDFRIDYSIVEKDVSFIKKLGVDIRTNTEVKSVRDLKAQGFDAVILAVGAYQPGTLKIEGCEPLNALSFMEAFNENKGKVKLGKNVVVIGAGNTAMDTARAAKRTEGVENAYLVYRRTKRYMPADEEELLMAIEDGVEFKELLAPAKWENGNLICHKMVLGDFDTSGRRGVVETDETVSIPADSVIVAVGEHVPTEFYAANGIAIDEKGKPRVDAKTLETNVAGVYVVGDGLYGPATIVEGIRDSKIAAAAITGAPVTSNCAQTSSKELIFKKKGVITESDQSRLESDRCLSCSTVCERCVDVCPNRANISITVPGMKMAQIVHVDSMCNECGNCATFCPYDSSPYKDKFTLFANEKDMADSTNEGFVILDADKKEFKVRLLGKETRVNSGDSSITADLMAIMTTICKDYQYLLMK
ncbi:MAG: putative selenate reductase subunit YgfK [Flexilinea sp.]